MRKVDLISMPFLSTYIDVRKVNFSHLLNPNWSIQISRASRMQGDICILFQLEAVEIDCFSNISKTRTQ